MEVNLSAILRNYDMTDQQINQRKDIRDHGKVTLVNVNESGKAINN